MPSSHLTSPTLLLIHDDLLRHTFPDLTIELDGMGAREADLLGQVIGQEVEQSGVPVRVEERFVGEFGVLVRRARGGLRGRGRGLVGDGEVEKNKLTSIPSHPSRDSPSSSPPSALRKNAGIWLRSVLFGIRRLGALFRFSVFFAAVLPQLGNLLLQSGDQRICIFCPLITRPLQPLKVALCTVLSDFLKFLIFQTQILILLRHIVKLPSQFWVAAATLAFGAAYTSTPLSLLSVPAGGLSGNRACAGAWLECRCRMSWPSISMLSSTSSAGSCWVSGMTPSCSAAFLGLREAVVVFARFALGFCASSASAPSISSLSLCTLVRSLSGWRAFCFGAALRFGAPFAAVDLVMPALLLVPLRVPGRAPLAVAPAKSSSLSDAPARDMDGWTLGAIAIIDSQIRLWPKLPGGTVWFTIPTDTLVYGDDDNHHGADET
ncbi:hypothetical protein KC338_g126 [Hortaea werneckii]|nr:hypothetical protein KC338_g126 [Hortaea werneckii]